MQSHFLLVEHLYLVVSNPSLLLAAVISAAPTVIALPSPPNALLLTQR
jgi:hypothetical protein